MFYNFFATWNILAESNYLKEKFFTLVRAFSALLHRRCFLGVKIFIIWRKKIWENYFVLRKKILRKLFRIEISYWEMDWGYNKVEKVDILTRISSSIYICRCIHSFVGEEVDLSAKFQTIRMVREFYEERKVFSRGTVNTVPYFLLDYADELPNYENWIFIITNLFRKLLFNNISCNKLYCTAIIYII